MYKSYLHNGVLFVLVLNSTHFTEKRILIIFVLIKYKKDG